ncbi:MAG: peptidylprolyl isomerase [Bdellovibrionia bacterium]
MRRLLLGWPSVFLMLWNAPVWGAPILLDRLEASVHSSLIYQSDLNQFRKLTQIRAQLDPLFAGTALAQKGAQAQDSEIISFLIDEKLIRLQFPVSDSEVEQEINSIQAANHLSRTALKEAIAEQGFDFKDYFELIRTGASKRNLIEREIRPKLAISEADIKNYYYSHYRSTQGGHRSYHLQIISIPIQNYKTVKDASEVAKRTLHELKTSAESFEEVAKRVSDDPSAASGGDLGSIAEEHLSSTFSPVKKMQIGEISPVLGGTELGRFLILKLVNIESNENHRLNELKDEIRAQLTQQQFAHQIQLWLERKKQSAFIHRAGEPSVKVEASKSSE